MFHSTSQTILACEKIVKKPNQKQNVTHTFRTIGVIALLRREYFLFACAIKTVSFRTNLSGLSFFILLFLYIFNTNQARKLFRECLAAVAVEEQEE